MFWKKGYAAKEIIVGLDFDGVLAHGVKLKMRYAREWFGVDLMPEQTKEKSFNGLMHSLGKNINYRSLMDPINEKHIMDYEIPHGCIETLGRLYSEGFRFVVVTSRNDHDFHYAGQFIKEKFAGIIKYLYNTKNEPKGRFIKKLKIRAYVDDDLKKLIEIEDTPAQLIYYRQPENKHINLPLIGHPRIAEIYDWGQFYELVHHIKDMHEAICWKYGIENNIFRLKEIDDRCRGLSKSELSGLVKEYKRIRIKNQ